ncbi:MAG: hypothetical protein LBF77_06135 [Spirochaetaceae bacterium]|jgi:hypothetical protein|nr:hypothetical protein [Spirochaetaceae bacterium]
MNIEKELEAVKKRLARLEKDRGLGDGPEAFEAAFWLPEVSINGLHFNNTRVRAVFEKQDAGWYHSRDVLFLSARNTEDDNSRDILAEYLNSKCFKRCLWEQLPSDGFTECATLDDLTVSLPSLGEGVKGYNGVPCGYWLAPPYSGYPTHFCSVTKSGMTDLDGARRVLGVAPCFRIGKGEAE